MGRYDPWDGIAPDVVAGNVVTEEHFIITFATVTIRLNLPTGHAAIFFNCCNDDRIKVRPAAAIVALMSMRYTGLIGYIR